MGTDKYRNLSTWQEKPRFQSFTVRSFQDALSVCCNVCNWCNHGWWGENLLHPVKGNRIKLTKISGCNYMRLVIAIYNYLPESEMESYRTHSSDFYLLTSDVLESFCCCLLLFVVSGLSGRRTARQISQYFTRQMLLFYFKRKPIYEI